MRHPYKHAICFIASFLLVSFNLLTVGKTASPFLLHIPSPVYSPVTDTLPASAQAIQKDLGALQKDAKAVDPKKESANLFKKVANFFKFKQNSRDKEKQRIVSIVEQLGMNDSIAATKKNITLLIDSLSKTENQHFNALLALVDKIKAGGSNPVDAIGSTTTGPAEETSGDNSANVVTDKDIEDLANKILPLVAEKAKDESFDKNKRATLAQLRTFTYKENGITYLHPDTTKHVVKRFRLQLHNKAEVYGFHYYKLTKEYTHYHYPYLNTLIYDALIVNGKTGNFKDLNGWDTGSVVTDAENAGCKVAFSVMMQNPESISTFLSTLRSQKTFINNALFLLKSRNAHGINLNFTGLENIDRVSFAFFVRTLYTALKATDTTYSLLLTLPVYDKVQAYDLKELNNCVDRFIIDFSVNEFTDNAASMDPLKGKSDYTIETSVSRYLNENIPPTKLVISFPYRGSNWFIRSNGGEEKFLGYLPYNQLRKKANWQTYYDDESGSAVMDSLNTNHQLVRQVWFEDEASLDKRYDFVLQNGLGGVAVNSLGFDDGYGELWDELAYKFVSVDTLFLPDSIIVKKSYQQLSFFEKLSRRLVIYDYILQHPCEICFNKIENDTVREKIETYLAELRVDSLVRARNKQLKKTRYHTDYAYMSDELTFSLEVVTLVLLALALIAGIIYIAGLQSMAENWKWKKPLQFTLIILSVLLTIFAFTYLFSNAAIPVFGASLPKMNDADSTVLVQTGNISGNSGMLHLLSKKMGNDEHKNEEPLTSKEMQLIDTYCTPKNVNDCINVPLRTLLAIVGFCVLLGGLLTRYLVLPLLKRTDIP